MARKRRPPRPGALSEVAPLRILRKILALQAAYYASAMILIVFTALVAGKELSVDLIFSWRSIRSDSTVGWMMAMIWLFNGLISVIFVLIVVVRSKLVLDFAFTVHFIHLIVTSVYSHSLPSTLFWWGLQISSTLLMTTLGIWVCQWRELKPIAFNFGNIARTVTGEEATRDGGASSATYELLDRGSQQV